MSEEVLEELYELLELYFEISPHGGFVKTFSERRLIEPQLDRLEMREEVYAKITSLIVGGE